MRRILFIFIVCIFFSCSTKKDIFYLQDIPENLDAKYINNLTIMPGDILDIQITALNSEALEIFQPKNASSYIQNNLQSRQANGYIVDDDGEIKLPIVGNINLMGKSTIEASSYLEKKLDPYITNSSVKIRLLNFKISVLGEVNKPGTFTIVEERVSIPQALGLASDLTINGDRSNILLIRSDLSRNSSYRVDLTSYEFLNSEFFYLKQNDVIYVQPNYAKVKSSGLVGNVGTLTAVLSLILSLTLAIGR